MSSKISVPLLLLAVLMSGPSLSCETHTVAVEEGTQRALGAVTGPSAQELQTLGVQARSVQDYHLCADAFADAARASAGARASANWYQASRCAARAGDYRKSGFHLQSAAAAGYADAAHLQLDPWMRPLHNSNRYQLALDIVTENQRTQTTQGPSASLCQLVQATRSHLRTIQDQEVETL